MKGNCGECERRYFCEIDPDECDEWADSAPQTNADRIRAMTDEELAKALHEQCDERESCYGCFAYRDDGNCPGGSRCAWLEWLQQPAEEKIIDFLCFPLDNYM